MSESEKKVPILKWAMETGPLKALLLAFAILCLSNGCKTSSARPSASLSGRWTGSGVFRGQTNPAIMDFYQVPDGWRAFGGRADLPDYLFTPLRNIRYQHPHLSFDLPDGPEHHSFEGTVSGKTIKVVSREKQVVLELQWTGDAPPLPFTEEAIEFRNGEVKFPVLLIFGEREDLVPVDRSVARIREAFKRAGNTRHTIKVFPGADHGITLTPKPSASDQRSVGVDEVPKFAPGYLETMTGWLREQLGLAR